MLIAAADRVGSDQRRRRDPVNQLDVLQRRRIQEREIEVAGVSVIDVVPVDVDERFGRVRPASGRTFAVALLPPPSGMTGVVESWSTPSRRPTATPAAAAFCALSVTLGADEVETVARPTPAPGR